ncbi:uncharacterized protein LOC135515504 [Oncorhynchus masou masou]|uniref:uncharacterized protein LOC135515504 n=1 Tax=Oncorhynchus masou masou TaxID=90313 RepID=UPI00318462FE
MVTELGGTVTLTCLSSDESVTRFNWFKQNDSYNLTISNTEPGDSATYYCSTKSIYELTYGEGTVLIVKDSESNSMSVLQQPLSESVQPGDSVTLNCTIHTETCTGEHSVLWFRHGSGESRPGIIYTHGNWSDQCEKSTETEKSCIYNLPKRNLSLSDAGTYYCAVASCEEIHFRNGTKLDIDVLCVTFTLIIVLVCIMYKMNNTTCVQCRGIIYTHGNRSDQCEKSPEAGSPTQSCVYNLPKRNLSLSDAGTYYCAVASCWEILFGNWTKLDNQDSDVVNYAAVSFTTKKSPSSRREGSQTSREDAENSEVRYLQQE